MNVENLFVKYLAVTIIIALALLFVRNPEQTLKPGLDLAGGHSLLYEIDTTDLDDTTGLSERIIEQLRKRVDPGNQRNLVWRSVGNTRIEIQMPSATAGKKELKTESDNAIEELFAKNVEEYELLVALESPEESRPSAESLARGIQARVPLIEDLEKAHANYADIKTGQSLGDEVLAYRDYQGALDAINRTNISRQYLFDLLNLETGVARSQQFKKLKDDHPDYAQQIDSVIETFDAWAAERGILDGPEELKKLLRGAGVLEFRILAERDVHYGGRILSSDPSGQEPIDVYVKQLESRGPRPKPGQQYQWFKIQEPREFFDAGPDDDLNQLAQNSGRLIVHGFAGDLYILGHTRENYGLLAGTDNKWKLQQVLPTRDSQTGRLVVSFRLDPRGGALFGRLTRDNKDRPMGVFLDNECMSYANILSEIHERGQIQGDFTYEDVNRLVRILEAGSLPARLKEPPLSERSIGASLGETNRVKGFRAAVAGLAAVAVFMLVYYLLSGLVANVALAMNILLVLAAMSAFQATFTLPGIAGLILTVGMAVDANVLILERIREELKNGASLKMAVKNGYDKAFSTILDANVTTLITCIILGKAGSEEIKGFAIVLGLGVVFSMFTALFVTRIIFAALVQNGLVKRLPMLRIVGVPSVNWLGMHKLLGPASTIVVLGGITVFALEHSTNKSSLYDIEFLGGTAVTIEFKDENITDDDVRVAIAGQADDDTANSAAGWLRHVATELDNLVSKQAGIGIFEISHTSLTNQQLEMIMMSTMSDNIESRSGIDHIGNHSIRVTFEGQGTTSEWLSARLLETKTYLEQAANRLASAKVTSVEFADEQGKAFDINSTETKKSVVRQAILAVLGPKLKVQQALKYDIHMDPQGAPQGYFPIHSDLKKRTELTLADVIGGSSTASMARYYGGVAFVFDNLSPAQTEEQLKRRLHNARQFSEDEYRPFTVIPLKSAEGDSQALERFALIVSDESIMFDDNPDDWESQLAQPQLAQAEEALRSEKSLQRVSQFAPQIAQRQTQAATMAIILALIAIVIYIWIRFGDMKFGLAAIVALVHDVAVTLGAVAVSYYVSQTPIGELLAIDDFKIDLAMVAAILTIVGYSLNDTIVVFDRIRENRGKLKELRPDIINTSINQTLSRTILTSLTTLMAVGVMYAFGGNGIHGFSYAMIIGVLVGSYSSVAVATPLVLSPRLLKWTVNAIVTALLVGLALTLSQSEFQVLVWILTGIFLLIVMITELKQRSKGSPRPVRA